MLPQKFLKIWVSKMTISSTFRKFGTSSILIFCSLTTFCKKKVLKRRILYWGLGKCSAGKFLKSNSQEGWFPVFWWQNWHQMRGVLSRLWLHFRFRWLVKRNLVSKQKRDQLHKLCRETEAHLLHMVTKHKFGIETCDIHIFWTIYFIKHSETKEKRELDKKAGLRCVNWTFGCVSVWKKSWGMCLGRPVLRLLPYMSYMYCGALMFVCIQEEAYLRREGKNIQVYLSLYRPCFGSIIFYI